MKIVSIGYMSAVEGSAPRAVADSMACTGNAITGRVPQSENPVFGPGEDPGSAESQPRLVYCKPVCAGSEQAAK